MAATDADRVLAKLRKLRVRIGRHRAHLDVAMRERDQLFLEGERAVPRATHAAMADAVGVTEIAVTQQLRKLRPPKKGTAKPAGKRRAG